MSEKAAPLSGRAAALQAAFDRSFAAPLPPDPSPGEDLLVIRIGAEPYALRLSQIAAIHPERPVTPLPGAPPALRGIAGFRGAVMPVYDLAMLLGHPPPATVRWFALAATEPVAFAFTAVERQLRIARDAIVPDAAGARPHAFGRGFARTTDDGIHPIVDLASVAEEVKRLIDPQAEGR